MTPGNAGRGPAIVRIEQLFVVSLAKLWTSLTLPEHISEWFARCQRVNASEYRLSFDEDGGVHVKTADVRRADCTGSHRNIEFDLYDPGHAVSIVRVDVHARAEGRVRLRLNHIDVPPELLESYRTGWRDYVRDLSAFITDGRGTRTIVPPGGSDDGPAH